MKIVYDSWGYSMTIVDFYAVIKETEKSITVVPMTSVDTFDGYLHGTTVAGEIVEGAKASLLLKRGGGMYVGTLHKANNHTLVRHFAHDWDGKPRDFNHCD